MAAALFLIGQRRNVRRNRIFRDRSHPLDIYDDVDFYQRFRFRRNDFLQLVDEVGDRLEIANRGHTVIPSLQLCVALRFYATGSFQRPCGDLVGVSQATASRIVTRVTNVMMEDCTQWITFPDQREADRQKLKFHRMKGFPNVFGAIDGTLINIQAPSSHEEDFVDRKGNHSLNVQVSMFRIFFSSMPRSMFV